MKTTGIGSQQSGVRSQKPGKEVKKIRSWEDKRVKILNFSISQPLIFCLLLFAVHCLLFTVFYGCASHKGPAVLTPLPTLLPGYTVSEQKIVFSSNDVRISILPLNSSETKKIVAGKNANNPLAEILSQPKYLAFLLDIENSSNAKVMYNPALTTLFDNDMGVHKPLDYTDLYTLVGSSPNPEAVINAVKDIIYDLDITIPPGQRSSRLLVFSGIEEETGKVGITMKEIYIGTSTIAVWFGFKISPSPYP